ncbi:hypothetical protein [Methanoregula sp. UBA64]|jgi:hypothetical protein|uniref:hypothetical protein n=1 Tax=Methanoregula sp. UBA64 TaxID=1915554 RepID=UPI0025F56B64|nr:hypothetical protein [Methanoregula sp. UBA64]
MRILLVEPEYYTKYPPLGLMKLASFYRSWGDEIKLVRGLVECDSYNPDKIEVTSLFTYAWQPVHKAIEYYHKKFPSASIRVGGIYASIMPEHIKKNHSYIEVHRGLFEKSESFLPSYDILQSVEKWRDWNSSIVFTSRGCIRKCPFCLVPQLEGGIKSVASNVRDYIFQGHKQIILWDNNFFASPDWKKTIKNLKETGLNIDFNQGLDARLIDEEKVSALGELKITTIRMAYDSRAQKKSVQKAIDLLEQQGFRKKKIFFYVLYNFFNEKRKCGDTPESFFEIINDLAEWGCVSYPMRYEPIRSLKKNSYVSPNWTQTQLESVADARRVIGFGGAFPPYRGLVNKFLQARNFDEAFELWPKQSSSTLIKQASENNPSKSETIA